MSYAQHYDARNNGPGFGGPSYGNNNNNNNNSAYGYGAQPTAGFMPASQPNDDVRAGPSETVQPLTVKQLLTATVDPSDDTKFNLNSVKLDQVTLVGRIVAADVQVTAITLTIDDYTGTIQGTYMVPIEDEMASSEIALQKRAWIKTGAWLRLVAAIHANAATRSLTVYRIRRVTDFNELLYHRLHVVKTFLTHTRPNPRTQSASTAPSVYASSLHPAANGVGAAEDGLAMNPLQRVIYEYVKSRNDNAQRGVTVDEVTQQAAAAHGATAATVKAILDGFASDGHMYTTIDENHYAFCRL